MITEDYVSFETAKLMKEKGFDEECNTVYSEYGELHEIFDKEFYESTNSFITLSNSNYNDITRVKYEFFVTAPTLQRTMKWLREKKGIAVIPVLSSVLDNEKFLWDIKIVVAKTNDSYSQGWVYETQESACETAIKYCLENLI